MANIEVCEHLYSDQVGGAHTAPANEYLYFYGQEAPKIETKYLTSLVAMCDSAIKELDADKEGTSDVKSHFSNTLKFIKSKSKSGDARYSAITLP